MVKESREDGPELKKAILRSQLGEARRQLSLVEAEVRALQVDAGVIRRDYHPPRRAKESDQGTQPA
jgi:hypothetical protein